MTLYDLESIVVQVIQIGIAVAGLIITIKRR